MVSVIIMGEPTYLGAIQRSSRGHHHPAWLQGSKSFYLIDFPLMTTLMLLGTMIAVNKARRICL